MGWKDTLLEQDLDGAERVIRSEVLPYLEERDKNANVTEYMDREDFGPPILRPCHDEHGNYDFLALVNSNLYEIEAKRDTVANDRLAIELFARVNYREGEEPQRSRIVSLESSERRRWLGRTFVFAAEVEGCDESDQSPRVKPGIIFDPTLSPGHLYLYRKAASPGKWWLFNSRKLTTFLRSRHEEFPYFITPNSGYYTFGVLVEARQLASVDELRDALLYSGVDPLASAPVARKPFDCDED